MSAQVKSSVLRRSVSITDISSARSWLESSPWGFPDTYAAPEIGSRYPASVFRIVDLPAPLGPMSVTMRPGLTSSSICAMSSEPS